MKPLVSVIIPTRNRVQLLAKCLESLEQLDYPAERIQIIVVNDGTKIREDIFQNSRGFQFEFIDSVTRVGASKARNLGIRRAVGEILVFIDDDVVVHPKWLGNLIGCLLYTSPSPRDLSTSRMQ